MKTLKLSHICPTLQACVKVNKLTTRTQSVAILYFTVKLGQVRRVLDEFITNHICLLLQLITINPQNPR